MFRRTKGNYASNGEFPDFPARACVPRASLQRPAALPTDRMRDLTSSSHVPLFPVALPTPVSPCNALLNSRDAPGPTWLRCAAAPCQPLRRLTPRVRAQLTDKAIKKAIKRHFDYMKAHRKCASAGVIACRALCVAHASCLQRAHVEADAPAAGERPPVAAKRARRRATQEPD